MHIARRSPIWVMWVGMLLHFIEKRLLTLFLDDSELRNFTIVVKDEAAVDALWICISLTDRHSGVYWCIVSYSA